MVDALVGKWTYESSENMDAYLEAINLPEEAREMARKSKPVVEISKDGTTWTFKYSFADKVTENKYVEGQEVEVKTLIGTPLKAIMNVKAASLVETHNFNGVDVTVERLIEGGTFVAKMSAKGVTTKAIFSKA